MIAATSWVCSALIWEVPRAGILLQYQAANCIVVKATTWSVVNAGTWLEARP